MAKEETTKEKTKKVTAADKEWAGIQAGIRDYVNGKYISFDKYLAQKTKKNSEQKKNVK